MTVNSQQQHNPAPDAKQIGDAIRWRLRWSPWIELRAICPTGVKQKAASCWVGHGDDIAKATNWALAKNREGLGVYSTFNVIKSRPKGSAKDEHVAGRSMLFIDIDPVKEGASATDTERTCAAEVADAVQADLDARGWGAPVERHDTGNGVALFYLCEPDISADAVNRLLAALGAQHATSTARVDTTVSNPARISRLPGTLNTKGVTHRLCHLLTRNPDPVTITTAMVADASPMPARVSPPPVVDRANSSIEARAVKYLGEMPAAISGQGGHPVTFEAARVVVYGFNLGVEVGLRLMLTHYNPRCVPVWSEKELRHKCEEADRVEFDKPRGWLLKARSSEPPRPIAAVSMPAPAATRPPHPTLADAAHGGPADWSRPLLFGSDGPPPEFPTHLLPDWWGAFVRATAEATQTPPDCCAGLSLAAICGGLGGKFRYSVRPGFTKNANVFVAVAMESGERKSAVFKAVFAPVWEAEQRARESAGPVIAQAAAERKTLEIRQNHLQLQAAKTVNPAERAELTEQVRELARELEAFIVPPIPRFVADDATPEALGKLLIEQSGRLMQAGPEGTCFKIASGRYSERENFDVYLKGHDGDPLTVDRAARGHSATANPCLTCGIALQPSVLHEMGSSDAARSEGFLARWLVMLPEPRVGNRKIRPAPVPPLVANRFATVLTALWGHPTPEEPAIVHFDSAADDTLAAFETWVEPQLARGESLSGMAGWGNKLSGEVARLAGAIHLASAAGRAMLTNAGTVGADSVQAAVTIAKVFLIPHARRAFGLMLGDPAEPLARRVLDRLSRTGEAETTRRELFQALKGGATKLRADDLDAPLELLCEHGYFRQIETPTRPGRPSERFAVNPLWNHSPRAIPRGNQLPGDMGDGFGVSEPRRMQHGLKCGDVPGDSGDDFRSVEACQIQQPRESDQVPGDMGDGFRVSGSPRVESVFELANDDRPEGCQ